MGEGEIDQIRSEIGNVAKGSINPIEDLYDGKTFDKLSPKEQSEVQTKLAEERYKIKNFTEVVGPNGKKEVVSKDSLGR